MKRSENRKGRADAVVIGGGIIGSSIAWRLAQGGMRVVLREAGRLGGEASSAGAGMLAPGGEVDAPSAFASLLVDSLAAYPQFVAELTEVSGKTIDFAICGAVEFPESDDRSQLVERAIRQKSIGIASVAEANGLRYPGDAIVDPVHVMAALRVACEESGVVIQENSPVRNIVVGGKSVSVDGEEVGYAVLSAGAWSSGISSEGASMPTSFPVKGHLLGYDMPPGSLPQILRRGHTYILQRRDGFTIVGSNMERVGFDRSLNAQAIENIRSSGEELWPELAGRAPSRVWNGFRPGIESNEVALYPKGRLWLAYGHFRNGILAAPATARYVADGILNASSGKD